MRLSGSGELAERRRLAARKIALVAEDFVE